MPGDLFAPVTAGDRWAPPSARQWNAILEAARAYARGDLAAGGPDTFDVAEAGREVIVSNGTGATVPEFGVLGVSGPLVAASASPADFKGRRALAGQAPAAGAPFVVTLEPIAAGKIGAAVVAGLVPVQVNVTDTAHRYAGPTTATDKLTSATSGPARLAYPAVSTGVQWLYVLVTQQAAAAGTGYAGLFNGEGIVANAPYSDGGHTATFNQWLGGAMMKSAYALGLGGYNAAAHPIAGSSPEYVPTVVLWNEAGAGELVGGNTLLVTGNDFTPASSLTQATNATVGGVWCNQVLLTKKYKHDAGVSPTNADNGLYDTGGSMFPVYQDSGLGTGFTDGPTNTGFTELWAGLGWSAQYSPHSSVNTRLWLRNWFGGGHTGYGELFTNGYVAGTGFRVYTAGSVDVGGGKYYDGATGTDPVGNQFRGGILTQLGGSGYGGTFGDG